MASNEELTKAVEEEEEDEDDVEGEGEGAGADASASSASQSKKKKKKKKKKGKKKKGGGGGEGGAGGGGSGWQNCFSDSNDVDIRWVEGKGRAFFAKRELKAGTCILSEKPFAVLAHNSRTAPSTLCVACAALVRRDASAILFPSSAFAADAFCSEPCKMQCAALASYEARISPLIKPTAEKHFADADLLRMTARLSFLLQAQDTEGGGKENDEEDEEAAPFFERDGFLVASKKGFMKLETHLQQQPVEWCASVSGAMRDLLEYLYTPSRLETENDKVDFLLGLAARINVNAYGMEDAAHGNTSIGFGLFPAAGLLINHSCTPNSDYHSHDGAMHYRLLQDVAAGTELTVSYVDLLLDTPSRRKFLLEKRLFLCTCSRCCAFDESTDCVARGAPLPNLFSCNAGRLSIDDELLLEELQLMDEAPKATNGKKKAKTPPPSSSTSASSSSSSATTPKHPPLSPSLRFADICLCGLYCASCGPSGVIISSSLSILSTSSPIAATNANSAVEEGGGADSAAAIGGGEDCKIPSPLLTVTSGCVVCGKKTAQVDAYERSLDEIREWWKTNCEPRMLEAKRSPSAPVLQAAIEAVEAFLSEYDPLASTGSGGSASAASSEGKGKNTLSLVEMRREERAKSRRSLMLHPAHGLLVEAHVAIAGLYMTKEPIKAVGVLRRVVTVLKNIYMSTHCEVANMYLELANALAEAQKRTTGTAAALLASRKQAMKQEEKQLIAMAKECRTICLGVSHPLTSSL